MVNPVLIQGIGVVALFANLSVFQTNTRKNMLLLGLCGCLLWATHFYLLGALTGAAVNLMAAGRFIVYFRVRPSKRNRWIMWSFIGLTALVTAFTWAGIVSLLPFLGTASGVIAFWQKNTKYIRRLALTSSPPWIIYAFAVGSYPGIITESLLMGSNLIGQYRFDFRSVFRNKALRAPKSA
ncbi:MAG TPA: YgjV family protein [Candidatus Saccharimonadales bacterium]|nr:YgjV family protein [Candidatus Saccharimonadales bacterium]